MRRCFPLLLVLTLTLSACAENVNEAHEPPCAALIGGGSYCLQASSAVAPFDLRQKVEIGFRGRRETLILNLENDADGLRFVGLTPFGHKLLQVSYDNHAASAAVLPDSRLRPSLLIALLQIALWPADVVHKGLRAPLTLEENASERRLMNAGEPTLSITHEEGPPPWPKLHLSVPAAGLEIDIETLPEVSPAL